MNCPSALRHPVSRFASRRPARCSRPAGSRQSAIPRRLMGAVLGLALVIVIGTAAPAAANTPREADFHQTVVWGTPAFFLLLFMSPGEALLATLLIAGGMMINGPAGPFLRVALLGLFQLLVRRILTAVAARRFRDAEPADTATVRNGDPAAAADGQPPGPVATGVAHARAVWVHRATLLLLLPAFAIVASVRTGFSGWIGATRAVEGCVTNLTTLVDGIERFRTDRRRLPDSLGELTPQYLAKPLLCPLCQHRLPAEDPSALHQHGSYGYLRDLGADRYVVFCTATFLRGPLPHQVASVALPITVDLQPDPRDIERLCEVLDAVRTQPPVVNVGHYELAAMDLTGTATEAGSHGPTALATEPAIATAPFPAPAGPGTETNPTRDDEPAATTARPLNETDRPRYRPEALTAYPRLTTQGVPLYLSGKGVIFPYVSEYHSLLGPAVALLLLGWGFAFWRGPRSP